MSVAVGVGVGVSVAVGVGVGVALSAQSRSTRFSIWLTQSRRLFFSCRFTLRGSSLTWADASSSALCAAWTSCLLQASWIWSAVFWSADARSAGIRAAFVLPQPPTSAAATSAVASMVRRINHRRLAASLPVLEALGERIGEVGGADGGLGARDVVVGAAPRRGPGVGVEHQPGGPRVAVARLAGGARIDEPLTALQIHYRTLAPRRAGRRLSLGAVERQRHVRVADERDPVVGRVEAQLGRERRQRVLPDR